MRNTTINEIFEYFTDLVQDRFLKNVYTTEDSIRYTLFYCLTMRSQFHPSDIILEYPYQDNPRFKVDMYVQPINNQKGLVFETKYDRKIPSDKNLPKPQKAGKIICEKIKFRSVESCQSLL